MTDRSPRRPGRILVVEDNPISRKLMRVTLESAGYEVLDAADGKTALELLARSSVDLILQDLLLPDMDGFDLVQRLRALPNGRQAAILAVSGLLSKLEQVRLGSGGFNDFVAKPVEPSRLVAIVRHFLPSESPRRAVRGNLLLVDDDPVQRKVAQIRLRQLGFAVTVAEDGIDALEKLATFTPDVIVSDVLMPRLDGFSLCQRIRADARFARVPLILASSAYVESQDLDLARQAGANTLVVRSPDLTELIDAVVSASRGTLPPPSSAGTEAVSAAHIERLQRQLEIQAALSARLAQRCSLQSAELSVLSTISEVLAGARTVTDVIEDIVARCLDACGLSTGMLYLIERGQTRLVVAIGLDPAARAATEVRFDLGPWLRSAADSGHTVVIPSDAVNGVAARELLAAMNASSALLVPMASERECLGVLVLIGTRNRDLTEDDWLPFARTAAAQVAQAISLRRAFDRLSASEARYRGLFDNARDAIVLTDDADHIVDANPAMCALSGYAVEELTRFRFTEIVPAAGAAARSSSDATLTGDYDLVMKDGGKSIVTLTVGDVGPNRHWTILHDVTEQRRLQAHVSQTEKLAAMGTLLAGVAHELNNPLSVVLGQAALLESAARDASVVARVQRIASAADRCGRVVKNFLALARQRPAERTMTSLTAVIEQAVELLAYPLRVDNVQVELRLQRDLPLLWADANQFHQVLVNLVANAHQAMRECVGSRRLTITTRFDAESDRVQLDLADTGPGIPPHIVNRIFEPFFTTKPPGQGTGLGLSLCRGIVETHGGSISVESQVGQGTIFHVALPVARTDAEHASGADAAAAPTGVTGLAILVVDDDDGVAQMLRDMLALDGHRADVVPDGRAALERLEHARYDIIVSDMRMPDLDGPGLYQEAARRRPELARRFVFLTGDTLSGQTFEFLERQQLQSLGKPFTLDEIRRTLRMVMAA